MHVQQLMTPAPRACGPDANLCEVVQMMWEGDFGVLPVVDDDGHVLGILTDRDVSIALGTRDRQGSTLRAAEVMTGPVKTCYGDEELTAAMQAMREYRVRRLPVVDHHGRLCGMLTLNDVILGADGGVRTADVLETLRAICEHYRPAQNAMVVAA